MFNLLLHLLLITPAAQPILVAEGKRNQYAEEEIKLAREKDDALRLRQKYSDPNARVFIRGRELNQAEIVQERQRLLYIINAAFGKVRRERKIFENDRSDSWVQMDQYLAQNLSNSAAYPIMRDSIRSHYVTVVGWRNDTEAIIIDSGEDDISFKRADSCRLRVMNVSRKDMTFLGKPKKFELDYLSRKFPREDSRIKAYGMRNAMAEVHNFSDYSRINLGNALSPVTFNETVTGGKADNRVHVGRTASIVMNVVRGRFLSQFSRRTSNETVTMDSSLFEPIPNNLALIPGQINGSDCGIYGILMSGILTINNGTLPLDYRAEVYGNLVNYFGAELILKLEEQENLFAHEVHAYERSKTAQAQLIRA